MMTEWKQMDDAAWAAFRTDILREKGGESQEDFLKWVRDGSKFIDAIDDRIPVVGDSDLDLYPVRLSEAQFKNPPGSTEARMYDLWTSLSPAVASSTSFWANATMSHVRSGRIEPSYLASNGVSSQTGIERIDRALTRSDANPEKQMDACVRAIVRQLGGLPQRGNRSVFADCPFARAWWRERLLRNAERISGVPKERIGKMLRQSKDHWVRFVSAMVSRNPVFGMSLVQNAAAVGLVRLLPRSPNEKFPSARVVQDVCQALCFIGGSRELGVLNFAELRQITESIVDDIRDNDQ